MRGQRSSRKGFTLVELMITIGIFGILAAIAFPQFARARFRARRTEVPLLLSEMNLLQFSWLGEYGCFISLRRTPEDVVTPSSQRNVWVSNPTPGTLPCDPVDRGFVDTEFRREGLVYFLYECEVSASPLEYSCNAVGDLNDDGDIAEFVYCTDYSGTGACIPTSLGGTPMFPFTIYRQSSARW